MYCMVKVTGYLSVTSQSLVKRLYWVVEEHLRSGSNQKIQDDKHPTQPKTEGGVAHSQLLANLLQPLSAPFSVNEAT